ncbi:MAG: hypothetical protein SNJ09_08275 [Rikenellaceae bacterium]
MMNIISKLRSRYYQLLFTTPNNQLFQQRANLLNESVLNSNKQGVTDYKYTDHQIIVSLTTFGVRLSQVYLAIESIMQQTKLANRIVLWLSDDLKGETLPQTLQNQMRRGLEIHYCKDIRSYKKLIPSLKMFPNDAIITIDDDLIYHITTLESLINSYLEDQNYIYYNRGHRAVMLNNKFMPYIKWEMTSNNNDISPLNFPTTGGGVIFPPHIFNKEVFNEEVFMQDCKFADDVWFYAMTLHNNKRSKRSKAYMIDPNGGYLENIGAQEITLCSVNVSGGMNDKQIDAVFNRYNLYEKLI